MGTVKDWAKLMAKDVQGLTGERVPERIEAIIIISYLNSIVTQCAGVATGKAESCTFLGNYDAAARCDEIANEIFKIQS